MTSTTSGQPDLGSHEHPWHSLGGPIPGAKQAALTLWRALQPLGVGVISEARHFCMMMRGVEKQHSGAVASAMLGVFRTEQATREEFLALVGHPSTQV